MKTLWIFLLLILSIACLVGAYYLLPKIKPQHAKMSKVVKPVYPQELDTLTLPALSGATFKSVALEEDVQPGDTLGFILRDRYQALRDSLFAFAKTSKSTANFSLLPITIREELNEMMLEAKKPTPPNKSKPERKSRYAVTGIERDYLSSEIMGAEDASTELIGKLSHLEDAGRGNSTEALNIRLKLTDKQEFITLAKRRLAERITYESTSSSAAASVQEAPELTAAQRLRILALSKELPLDTQRVFAPIAGRYYRPDEGVGYIIAASSGQKRPDFSRNKESEDSGYILEAQGSPVLWGKAQRKNDEGNTNEPSDNELRVSVD